MPKSGKFLIGALVGAAAAALLTPVAGKKARQKLAEQAKKAGMDREKFEEVVETVAQKGSELLKQAQSSVGARKTKTKTKKK